MLPNLTATEARVIGCLMEKSVITPDQYPMTLNALTGACNQKSSRDPVMSLEQNVVQRAARELASKHLVRADENFKSGVVKYRQRLCNTMNADYRLDSAHFAIVCLLLLRGPQTPGELRARSGRLHTFADNSAVVDALNGLIEREGEPLVVQLELEVAALVTQQAQAHARRHLDLGAAILRADRQFASPAVRQHSQRYARRPAVIE